jgi:tRNA modification GTPase
VVSSRFQAAAGKSFDARQIGRVAFGRFQISPTMAEEVVVGFIAPDQIEIHCHGGRAVIAAISDALVALGCVSLSPAEWAQRQETDRLAAEAILALAESRTETAAMILLDQYRNSLRTELSALVQLLARGDASAATEAIELLLTRAELGLHLTQPWKVVIAGAPNVGKSSLANVILGYERAIVFPQAGTTRDVLTATTAIGGWPVELADVAGLRTAADTLEAEGIARALREISAADLAIYVAATPEPWNAALYEHVAQPDGRRLLIAHNKCDLAPPPSDGRPAGIEISAKTGFGIDNLLTAIAHALVPNPPPRGAAVPFTEGQVTALEQAMADVAHDDLATASDRIAALIRKPDDAAPDYNGRPST